MGAEVFMSARKKEDLAWIEAHGMIPLKTYGLSSENTKFDVIFNTVPHMVLREEVLKKLQGSPLIIELASKPYGADFKQKNKSRKTAFIFLLFIYFQDSVLHQPGPFCHSKQTFYQPQPYRAF
jgi:dipicolinate synthase subunit A